MDNSVENMEIRLLEREKWRGFVLDMDYVACERYETRVSDGKDGSSITLTRRNILQSSTIIPISCTRTIFRVRGRTASSKTDGLPAL